MGYARPRGASVTHGGRGSYDFKPLGAKEKLMRIFFRRLRGLHHEKRIARGLRSPFQGFACPRLCSFAAFAAVLSRPKTSGSGRLWRRRPRASLPSSGRNMKWRERVPLRCFHPASVDDPVIQKRPSWGTWRMINIHQTHVPQDVVTSWGTERYQISMLPLKAGPPAAT